MYLGSYQNIYDGDFNKQQLKVINYFEKNTQLWMFEDLKYVNINVLGR